MRRSLWCLLALVALLGSVAQQASATVPAASVAETMDMLGRAIAFQTVKGRGQVPLLARYLASRLESAGFDPSNIKILRVGETAALVVRYPGRTDAPPIVLNGHLDVVPATPSAWGSPPFQLTRRGKYLYGRGVSDMKSHDVVLVETFMRLKREHFVPSRTIILAFTGDEETDQATTRLLARRLAGAEFVLDADESTGGGVADEDGNPLLFKVQLGEKTYADFEFSVDGLGGHSSEPRAADQNPIYQLASALRNLAAYQFPVRHNAITIPYFSALGRHEQGAIGKALRAFANNPNNPEARSTLAANRTYKGLIRTTCVATMLHAGLEANSLPKHAAATVNCRIWPDVTVATVRATLSRVVGNPAVHLSILPPTPVESGFSPLDPTLMGAITKVVQDRHPGLPVVPFMSAAATDCMYFRAAKIPCYGVNGMFVTPGDDHMHGVNERLPVAAIPEALRFWYRLIPILAGRG